MAVTQQDINDLQTAHYDLFKALVDGAKFRVNLARQYGLQNPNFLDFNKDFVPLVQSWINREIELETVFERNTGLKGMIFSGDLDSNDFYMSASLPKLDQLVNNYFKYYQSLG